MAAVNFYLPYRLAVKPTNVGAPGSQLLMYAPGTTTKRPMYTTSALTIQHPNPLIADGAGRWPAVYLDNSLTYKYVVKDSAGAVLDQMDPYIPGQAPDASELQPYADAAAASATSASASAATALAAAAGLDPADYFIVTPQMYGAVGNGVTDDSAAFVAALAALQASATVSAFGYGTKGCPKLTVPAGHYYLGTTTLDLTATVIIEGDGGGFLGGPTTILRWADGTTGIRTQAANTSGATGPAGTNRGYTAAGSVFRNLFLRGGYAGSESEHYGIQFRVFAKCENVYVDNFPGDGFYAAATIGDATTEGNASECAFRDCVATNNRNGFFFDGADANASLLTGCDSRGNRQWGYWDSSFLGNSFISCKASANGWDGAIGSIPTGSTYCGMRYFVQPGQATAASTNAPYSSTATITIASPGVVTWNAHGLVAGTPVGFATTGALPTGITAGTVYYVVSPTSNTFSIATAVGGSAINTSGSQSGTHTAAAGIDNTYWGYKGLGGTFNGVVAWVSGTTFREGGCFKTDNANNTGGFAFCYAESDQNPAQIQSPSMVLGGNVGNANTGLNLRTDSTGALQLGRQTGPPATEITYFESTASLRYMQGRYWSGGQSFPTGHFAFWNGGGIIYDVDNAGYSHFFRVNGNAVVTFDSTGLLLSSGKVLKVNGTQVLGPRVTGWTAATGTATRTSFATGSVTLSALAQAVKALIDDLTAHGVIGA